MHGIHEAGFLLASWATRNDQARVKRVRLQTICIRLLIASCVRPRTHKKKKKKKRKEKENRKEASALIMTKWRGYRIISIIRVVGNGCRGAGCDDNDSIATIGNTDDNGNTNNRLVMRVVLIVTRVVMW